MEDCEEGRRIPRSPSEGGVVATDDGSDRVTRGRRQGTAPRVLGLRTLTRDPPQSLDDRGSPPTGSGRRGREGGQSVSSGDETLSCFWSGDSGEVEASRFWS